MDIYQRFKENQKLVGYVLKGIHLTPSDIDYEDLMQEGYIGLWKACNTYDDSKGYTFSTYAIRCISTEILQIFRKRNAACRKGETLSLDEPYDTGKDIIYLRDIIPAPKEEEIYYQVYKRDLYDKIRDIYLDEDEGTRKILYLYYIEGKKQMEIGKMTDYTQATISRKLKRFAKKLTSQVEERI